MTEPERTTIARLREHADTLVGDVPELNAIRKGATRRRRNHRIAAIVAATVLGAAIVVPLRALSGLGDDGVTPQADPWTESYVLSDFQVQYPMLVPDVAVNEPVERDTPLKPDPTMALVTFRSTWSGDVYPGEAQCEIRLFDADGATVGHESFGFGSFEPPPKNPTSMEVAVDEGKPKPVSADGTCGPGARPGPGTYLVSNLHVVAGDNGDRLMGDVAWSTESPPRYQYCVATFEMPDGTRQEKPFEMSVPQEKNTTILLLPHGYVDATPVGVRCEPYTGHNGETGTGDSTSSIAVGDDFGGFSGLVLSEVALGTDDFAPTDFEGEFKVAFFWASWHHGSSEYLGALERMDQHYGDRVAILGIDVRDEDKAALALMRAVGVSFVNLADPSGDIADRFRVAEFPTAIVVDGQTQVVKAVISGWNPEALQTYMATLLDDGFAGEPTYYVDGARPAERSDGSVRCVPWSAEVGLRICGEVPEGFTPGGPPGGINRYPDVCALALELWDFDPDGTPVPAALEDAPTADERIVEFESCHVTPVGSYPAQDAEAPEYMVTFGLADRDRNTHVSINLDAGPTSTHLGTGQLTAVAPMPQAVIESAGIWREIARRTEAWSEQIAVDQMSSEVARDAILTIWDSFHDDAGNQWWLAAHERGARIQVLCERLASNDPLRSDFCS